MSALSVKTASTASKMENASRVLPGDKTGLPWEVWRLILSFLSVQDLGRASCVSKTWRELIGSLDSTRWKELYLRRKDWRHPYWPLHTNSDPPSWKEAYKHQKSLSQFWSRPSRQIQQTGCAFPLKRRRERKILSVGQNQEYRTLKGALAVAHDYDRIEVHPGIYDESFDITATVPFELVGIGELGSVILVMCLELVAVTGRISNVVLRAPWFTAFILEMRSGFLQVDSCIVEDGIVFAHGPASCLFQFCTFRHTHLLLQHLHTSVIQNCEFSQSDTACVIVEGYSREDRGNWTSGFLSSYIQEIALQRHLLDSAFPRQQRYPLSASLKPTTSLTSGQSTNYSTVPSTHIMSDAESHYWSENGFHGQIRGRSVSETLPKGHPRGIKVAPSAKSAGAHEGAGKSEDCPMTLNGTDEKRLAWNQQEPMPTCSGEHSADSLNHAGPPVVPRLMFGEDSEENSSLDVSRSGHLANGHHGPPNQAMDGSSSENCRKTSAPGCLAAQDSHSASGAMPSGAAEAEERRDEGPVDGEGGAEAEVRGEVRGEEARPRSGSTLSYDDSEDELSIVRDLEAMEAQNASDSDDNDDDTMTTSSGDEEDHGSLGDTDSEDVNMEESVIMLPHLRHSLSNASLSAHLVDPDVTSVDSCKPALLPLWEDVELRRQVGEAQGVLVHRCRMLHSKGGVMVSLAARATIQQCHIANVAYGIRCVQNSKVTILRNSIHHCRTSGIFMRLAATGVIAGNDIHSNSEAGIDIRKSADPLIQNNRIHHGKRSGVVVLGSGRGQIRKNEIYDNREAGVYILYGGNPTVSENRIYAGRAAGVAVNEGGKGVIYDNTIEGNHWGGVDIRHEANPIVCGNAIINGLGDGIVFGEKGRGSVENNVISGNAGCGVWVMSGSKPYIHGNQISNNGDCGVMLVNKQDIQHTENLLVPAIADPPSSRSLSLAAVMEDDNLPTSPHFHHTTLQYNNIFHNLGRGVLVQMGEEVEMLYNAIYANHADGVAVYQSAPVTIRDNSITCNHGNGIVSAQPCKMHILGNGVFDNKDHGVYCVGEAVILENDVVGNAKSGITLVGNPSVAVQRNRVQCAGRAALHLTQVEGGQVEDNQVFGCVTSSLVVRDCHSGLLLPSNGLATDSRADKEKVFDKAEFLRDPDPRPHILPPPAPTTVPAHHISAVTRVTLPAGDGCQQPSKLCTLL